MKISTLNGAISITPTPTLTPEELALIESDPAAMRAVIDGSCKIPPTVGWIKFYHNLNFCGGIALLNILPDKRQVEFHLFFLSSAPKHIIRHLGELAYIYAVLHRLQPYTVIRAIPELQYMHNFMLRLGCKRVPHHGRYFYFLDANWTPKYLTSFEVIY